MTVSRRLPAPELAALLLVAFALRLGVFYLRPNVHWPDEIFQVMEPAHRLVFGTGAVSWEWVVGIRSWLLPGLVAGLMEAGRALGNAPAEINLPVAIFMAAAGCAPVACGYGWGNRLYGRAGGFVAASVAVLWVDLVYMSPHTLTEVVAADCLPVALYLGLPGAGEAVSRRRLWLAGGLLGLTLALRFHLAPALAVAAIGICGGKWWRWRAVIVGACVPVLALGLLDWATLGMPFRSVSINLWFNLALGVSDEAGRLPFLTLWILPLEIWGVVGYLAVLMLAIVGARRCPVPAFVALAVIATHSFIPHKEYRFTYPAIVLVAILAGLGTAELARAAARWMPRIPAAPAALAGLAMLLWAALSWSIAERPIFATPWTRERAQLLAFADIVGRGDACGVGLYGLPWTKTPGASWLPPRAALSQTDTPSLAREAAGFNYIVAREQAPVPDSRYRRTACFVGDRSADGRWLSHLCVWRRAGGCDAAAAPPLPVNWPGVLMPDQRRPAPPGWGDESDEH
jgi:hypothetical protein